MICASAYTVFELMLVFVIGMAFLPVIRVFAYVAELLMTKRQPS